MAAIRSILLFNDGKRFEEDKSQSVIKLVLKREELDGDVQYSYKVYPLTKTDW